MRILDRYIVRNFLFTALLFFLVMISLRIIVDMFVNMDEFLEGRAESSVKIQNLLSYYFYQIPAYLVELGGIIIVLAAAFTVARMNHTNELTAMMASGMSLHRVVLPIIMLSLLLDVVIIYNQEILIPQIAEKLVRSPDGDLPGKNQLPVRLQTDENGSVWYSPRLEPRSGRMKSPLVLIRAADYSLVGIASGNSAIPGTLDGQEGWLFSGASPSVIRRVGGNWLHTPDTSQVWTRAEPGNILQTLELAPSDTNGVSNLNVRDARYGLEIKARRFEPDSADPGNYLKRKLIEPKFIFRADQGEILGVIGASSAGWVQAQEDHGYWNLENGFLFYPSDLKVEDIVLKQSSRWLDYMSSRDLSRLIQLRKVPDRNAALLARHVRFTNPLNNLIMLLLALPFILSRERNLKTSASIGLLIVAAFYMFIYGCRYMNMEPVLAAWLPTLTFGPAAVVMLDSVKT